MHSVRILPLLLLLVLGAVFLAGPAAADAQAGELPARFRLEEALFKLEHELHALQARLLELKARLAALEEAHTD